MDHKIEFAIDTFGDVSVTAEHTPVAQAQVIRDVIDQAVLADEVGVDVFGVGEHHRDDFAISAPEVVLGAIASRTERIRLTTSVTILSSDDPVRVYEQFATLDAISDGRAEVIVGRGSFTESFPLFGYDLSDYEVLFNEKLALFVELLDGGPTTWSGTIRAPLDNQVLYPRLEHGRLRTWVGVGGTPNSVVRAAGYQLPLMLAIIGGEPRRFAALVEHYRKALDEFGHERQPVGAHCLGHVAPSDAEAIEDAWEPYAAMHKRIASERGWPPVTRAGFEALAGPTGAFFMGSPETVATKIVDTIRALDLSRFTLKVGSGPMPNEVQRRCIELYGTEVIPRVRELLSDA